MVSSFEKENLRSNPLEQFNLWFQEIQKTGTSLPEAFCLSTVGENNHPDARMLLLKGVDEKGFVFYTNLLSVKGQQLNQNKHVAMTWYWEALRRQVRVLGSVESVTSEEADVYFASRPRDSQIGAWASHQSEVLESRAELEQRFADYQKKFEGISVPRPPHWSGLRVMPSQIEFWQECPNRLHDRFQYLLEDGKWVIYRLSP